jgi:hypothetical protein
MVPRSSGFIASDTPGWLILQQSLFHGLASRMGASLPHGNMNRLAGSAFESNVSRDLLWTANQSDIFD